MISYSPFTDRLRFRRGFGKSSDVSLLELQTTLYLRLGSTGAKQLGDSSRA